MLAEAFGRLLADHAGPASARAAEAGALPQRLSEALLASGFLDLMVAEEAGGAGLGLPDLFPLALAAGRHLLPLPFAETVVARALFGEAMPAGGFALLVAPSPILPMARAATHAVVAGDDGVLLAPLVAGGDDPWRTGAATVAETGEPVAEARGIDLGATAAALAAARIAGLIAGAAELAQAHVAAREQFGRPLAAFQAIQQQMARLAEELVAARAAASLALSGRAVTKGGAAVAKARASEAAVEASAILHQVHGAIGMTAEYDLGLYTRRLQEARIAFGSERCWAAVLAGMRLDDRDGHAVDFLRRTLETA